LKDENTVTKNPANTELRLNINRAFTLKAWKVLEKAIQEIIICLFTMLRKCTKW